MLITLHWLKTQMLCDDCLTDYMIQQIIYLELGLFNRNNEANDCKLPINGKNWGGGDELVYPGRCFLRWESEWTNSKPCRCWLKVSG